MTLEKLGVEPQTCFYYLSDLFEVQFPYLLNGDAESKLTGSSCLLNETMHEPDNEDTH